MTVKDMHEYLFDCARKELGVFGKEVGAERIKKNLEVWEKAYGSQVADKARKLIVAEWRKRFKTSGSGLGSAHRRVQPDEGGGVRPDVPAAEELQPERRDG